MFWRLGFLSAWRNLARSVLAILSMAMAAGFLTNAVSLSRGYTAMQAATYRSINGGEVTVYDRQLLGAGVDSDLQWSFQKLHDAWNTDLQVMMPQLLQGYLAPQKQAPLLTPQRIAEIGDIPTVKAVYPRYQLPAMSSGHSGQWVTPLRGRDPALDALQTIAPQVLVSEGRWLEERDAGQMVAVVSSSQHYPPGQAATGLGDEIRLLLPRVIYDGERVAYDYQEPLLFTFKVVGVMDITTRIIFYTEFVLTEAGIMEVPMSFPLYMQCDEIQIPLTTWHDIWRQVGGQEYIPQQLALMTDDMSYLEDVALQVQNQYPEYTVISAPQLLQQALDNLLLDNPEKYIHSESIAQTLLERGAPAQQAMAADLRVPLTIMIFINAAMVIASNLLIMVNERRTEIGILKAVGSKRSQVIQMVLSEALLISLVGSSAGFIFFRLPAVFTQLTNRVTAMDLIFAIGADLALVLGTTFVAALLFGLLPALTMARLSVREVLQSE